uniref:Uncharacterized protein n=1 Tax=Pan paniscus TaxID=9597 RepID=A0A2R9BKD3_PANPA
MFTSAHKNCPMPQGADPLNPDLPSGRTPTVAPDRVIGKDKQMDFCWDPWQRCFQTTNGYLSDSRSRPGNYNVAALATSSLVGVVQNLESIYLQDSLPSGPSQDDSLQAFSSPSPCPDSCPSPEEPPSTTGIPQPPSPELQHRRRLPGAQGPEGGTHLPGSLPSMDSGSLWEEDEVFYN